MNKAIGVLDSGVGGLTVVKEIMRQLPKETIIYIGDTKRCPYGSRPSEEVLQYTWEMVSFLIEKNIKMLVIACNTATAFALNDIRKNVNIPVIGVIHPGARSALKMTKNKRIGIIGTEGTVQSRVYEHVLKSINSMVRVKGIACPKFVPLVENNCLDGDDTFQVVQQSLVPFQNEMIDTLILGCTHYPLLEPLIQEAIGQHVTIISSGAETAREVSTILSHNEMLCVDQKQPAHYFYTTGERDAFLAIADRWLETPIEHMIEITLS